MDEFAHLRDPSRDPQALLAHTLSAWGARKDLWVFGYASLIWNPGFDYTERRVARVYGHHRALKMWSRINRGTPQCPGLVAGLDRGGSCAGVVYRVPAAAVRGTGVSTDGKTYQNDYLHSLVAGDCVACHREQSATQPAKRMPAVASISG